MERDNTEFNIDKYVQGELIGDALIVFEALLEKDKALQKKVNFSKYADSVLHKNLASTNVDDSEIAELNPILQKLGDKYFTEEIINKLDTATAIVKEETTEKSSIIKRLLPFATLAAAAALLLFLFLPKQDNQLFESYFAPAELINVQSPVNNLTDFEKANTQYNSKNYKKAIVLYDKYLTENKSNSWALVYKGCAHMALKQTDKAMDIFQQLATQHSDFEDIAHWYLALCYLKKGNKAQTESMLKSISPNDKEYYAKGQKLLEEL